MSKPLSSETLRSYEKRYSGLIRSLQNLKHSKNLIKKERYTTSDIPNSKSKELSLRNQLFGVYIYKLLLYIE